MDKALRVLLFDGSCVTLRLSVRAVTPHQPWMHVQWCDCGCAQTSLVGQELFDMIASQFGLHEKAYFGITWQDKEYGPVFIHHAHM